MYRFRFDPNDGIQPLREFITGKLHLTVKDFNISHFKPCNTGTQFTEIKTNKDLLVGYSYVMLKY